MDSWHESVKLQTYLQMIVFNVTKRAEKIKLWDKLQKGRITYLYGITLGLPFSSSWMDADLRFHQRNLDWVERRVELLGCSAHYSVHAQFSKKGKQQT